MTDMYYQHFIEKECNRRKIDKFNEQNKEKRDFPFLRFWKTNLVQIDGDMTLDELKQLVELMESFENES